MLSPFEGPSLSPWVLLLIASLAGVVGTMVWFQGLNFSLDDMLCFGVMAWFSGATIGTFGSLMVGQIARVVFQAKDRRYSQAVGAFLLGIVGGVLPIYGLLWMAFSGE
jgi:hypothetical protein